jgi:uncharacterized protein (TIGR00299 family) protein
MNTLYLDIFSGISGDMFMGAMLDLGIEMEDLTRELEKLHLEGYHLHASRERRMQIEGARFQVHLGHHHDEADHHEHDHGHHHHHEDEHGHKHEHGHSHDDHDHPAGRTYSDIRRMIQESGLSDFVKSKSIAVFERIAAAEGKIHGLPPEEVHFHEVGAVDSIVDIVGACVALEILGKPRVLASSVVEGHGFVECAHGRFPVPAPATLEILAARGVPLAQCDEPNELVTPTGAALLAEFVEHFGPMENFVPQRVGFGVGGRDNKSRPNVLRAVLGQTSSVAAHDWESDTISVLETNLDDVNPELLGHFVDLAMSAGALDVAYAPVQMKKNRPGVLLSVLCATADADKFCEMILRETSAFGVRRSVAERRKLRREFATVKTPYGEVTMKIGRLDGKVVQTAPEFESCKKLAAEKNVPLKAVYEAARKAAP